MSNELTRDEYERLLTEDIMWLLETVDDTPERRHIILTLMNSPSLIYEDEVNHEMFRGIPQSRVNKFSMFDKVQMACPQTACITQYGESKCYCKLELERKETEEKK